MQDGVEFFGGIVSDRTALETPTYALAAVTVLRVGNHPAVAVATFTAVELAAFAFVRSLSEVVNVCALSMGCKDNVDQTTAQVCASGPVAHSNGDI